MDLELAAGTTLGSPLNLDPYSADTSGDGLLDHEQVEIDWGIEKDGGEWVLHAELVEAIANPRTVDSTGDGLSDRQQLDGWTIYYTDSPAATFEFFDLLDSENGSEDDLLDVLASRNVTADPLAIDTSGDGFSDVDNFEFGLDPRTSDTTEDGISDLQAIEAPREDPTLFTITPPVIELTRATFEKPPRSFTAEYEFRYIVEDDSGLARVTLEKDGTIVDEYTYAHAPTHVHEHSEFTTTWDTVLDVWLGATVTIETEDVHGNVGHQLAYQRSSFYGELAGELGHDGLAAEGAAYPLGVLAGFSYGFGELVEVIELLLTDPLGMLDEIRQVIAMLRDDLGVLWELIAQLPEQVRETQHQDNPHDPGDPAYDNYANGWYAGYLAYFVVEMVVPLGEAYRTVDSVTDFSRHVDRVTSQASDLRPILRDRTPDLSTRSAFLLDTRGAMTPLSTVDVLGQIKTATQQALVIHRLQQIDTNTLSRLRGHEAAVGQFLKQNGNDGVQLLREFEPATAQRLFEMDAPGVDGAALRENLVRQANGDFDRPTIETFVNDAHELRHVEGYTDLMQRAATRDAKNFKGTVFEARVAASHGSEDVIAIGRNVGTTAGTGEIDVITSRGDVIEVKSGGKYSNSVSGDPRYNSLANQLSVYKAYHQAQGLSGDVKIIFKREPSGDIQNLLKTKRGMSNVENSDYYEWSTGV